jgi:hypothetical protein
MRVIHTKPLVGVALLSAASPASADTVRPKSGTIFVGDVALMESGGIQISTRIPREESLTLAREDPMPRSLYDLLGLRAGPGDCDARQHLGELARSGGPRGLAIANFLTVAELRPDLLREMSARVGHHREVIAGEILEEARKLFDDGSPGSARIDLHTLQGLYLGTEDAKRGANGLTPAAHDHAGGASDMAQETKSVKWAPKTIEGDREMRELKSHEGDSTRNRRAVGKAIRHFAWDREGVKAPSVTVQDLDLQTQIQGTRRSVKGRLAEACSGRRVHPPSARRDPDGPGGSQQSVRVRVGGQGQPRPPSPHHRSQDRRGLRLVQELPRMSHDEG